MPASHHSVFTGQMPFLPPNEQLQSTEGMYYYNSLIVIQFVDYGVFCLPFAIFWVNERTLTQCTFRNENQFWKLKKRMININDKPFFDY